MVVRIIILIVHCVKQKSANELNSEVYASQIDEQVDFLRNGSSK